MFAKQPLRLTTDLEVIPFSSVAPPGDMDWIVCTACGLGLGLHQPDLKAPARLLGTCEGCGRWYVILMEPGLTSALMVAFPESETFRGAWDGHGGPDGRGGGSASGGSDPASRAVGRDGPIGGEVVEGHSS